MCAASTASPSSSAARARSQASRKSLRPRPSRFSKRVRTRPRSSSRRTRPRRSSDAERPRALVECRAGVVEPTLQPLRPRELRQHLREDGAALLDPGPLQRAPRTGARSRPGRRSPRAGRGRRAGRSRRRRPSRGACATKSAARTPPRSARRALRRSGAPRTRRVWRRSRRRACRPSAGCDRTARPADLGSIGPSARAGRGRPAIGLGKLVGDVEPGDARRRRVRQPCRILVAEVERVRHDPDVGRAPLRRAARVHRRSRSRNPSISRCAGWIGSRPRRHALLGGRRRRLAVARRRRSRGLRRPSAAAEGPLRQSTHSGVVGREPSDRVADRLDALLGLRRALHSRDRELQERRNDRDAVRHREPVRRGGARVFASSSAGSLNSQRPIASKPGRRVGGDVLGEGGVQGRDRRRATASRASWKSLQAHGAAAAAS